MTESAMLTHAATAYLRGELGFVIHREADQTREYVAAQNADENGSRQMALEYSEAFLSWLVIAFELREHMDVEPCDKPKECGMHQLCADLVAQDVTNWFDPMGLASPTGSHSHPSNDPFFSDPDTNP